LLRVLLVEDAYAAGELGGWKWDERHRVRCAWMN
jgi:hypothetical protein